MTADFCVWGARLPIAAARLGLASLLLVAVCSARADEAADENLWKDAQANFAPLPADMATANRPIVAEQVRLGRMLFFEPRASADGTVSCSRCHLATLQATDGLPKSRGAHDFALGRNAPTVFNAALQFKIHWDGGNDDVEMQARRAITGPGFGNPDAETPLARLRAIPEYKQAFQRAFPHDKEVATLDLWATAIGAYERTLISPSRFDDYLRGKREALTADERQGLRKFIAVGCADCHHGAGLGGTQFEKFGVVGDYWVETKSPHHDKGRFDVTHNAEDTYVFKVPILRNVTRTPPYFHDGSVQSLADAVKVMAKVQLGETLADADLHNVVAFLECLTGSMPQSFGEAPALPSAGFVPPPDKPAAPPSK